MFDQLTAIEAIRLMSKLSNGFRRSAKLSTYCLQGGYGWNTTAYQQASAVADELHILFTDVSESASMVAA